MTESIRPPASGEPSTEAGREHRHMLAAWLTNSIANEQERRDSLAVATASILAIEAQAAPSPPSLDVIRDALTDEDEIGHAESWHPWPHNHDEQYLPTYPVYRGLCPQGCDEADKSYLCRSGGRTFVTMPGWEGSIPLPVEPLEEETDVPSTPTGRYVLEHWEDEGGPDPEMARAIRKIEAEAASRESLERERPLLSAMVTWPTGANGPIAIATYEALVRRLHAALQSTDDH
jgi:hypothetical protein